MAKSVRRRGLKTKTRKAPARGTRIASKSAGISDKFKALVYNLSAADLDELIKVATARKNEALATAKASFFDEVKARAASLGVSLADLVGVGGGSKAPKSAGEGRAPASAKYRNPKTGETWAGRGRPARWITELEAQGHKREEFAV